jgi:hypothetical protein
MQLGVDCAVPGYQDTSYQCLQLLVNLLIFNAIDGRAPYIDTDKHQRQLESVAYTLQLVKAAGRSQAASLKTMLSVLGEQGLQQLQSGTIDADLADRIQLPYVACMSANRLVAKADQSNPLAKVMGSLQGQQLLQSCTSLLLTCRSIMQDNQLGCLHQKWHCLWDCCGNCSTRSGCKTCSS